MILTLTLDTSITSNLSSILSTALKIIPPMANDITRPKISWTTNRDKAKIPNT